MNTNNKFTKARYFFCVISFALISILNTASAGPLDAKRLDFLEIKNEKKLISIECKNLDRNLIDCENFYIIESSTKDTDSNDELLELNRMEITKEQFEQAATEFSKKFKTKTGYFIFTAIGGGVGILVYFIVGKRAGLAAGLIGAIIGGFIDLSFAPIIVPIKIKREIYQAIKIKRNIKNLLENKKFKKIKIRQWLFNQNDNSKTFEAALEHALEI